MRTFSMSVRITGPVPAGGAQRAVAASGAQASVLSASLRQEAIELIR